MTITVIARWEFNYMVPLVESTLWAMALREFEVSEWWMSPITGIHHSEKHLVNLYERQYYEDIFEEIDPNLPRVFFEPRRKDQNPDTIWLHDFEHPEDCVYIFGATHYNPTLKHKREQDEVVSIKTVQDKGVLLSSQCLLVVLYDRLMKNGCNNC
jgi:hypothetical protein